MLIQGSGSPSVLQCLVAGLPHWWSPITRILGRNYLKSCWFSVVNAKYPNALVQRIGKLYMGFWLISIEIIFWLCVVCYITFKMTHISILLVAKYFGWPSRETITRYLRVTISLNGTFLFNCWMHTTRQAITKARI